MAERFNAGVMGNSAAAVSGVIQATPGVNGERQLRVKGARIEGFAPQSFTGCVSEISSRASGESFHAEAFKRYAEVYEAYQAYLLPAGSLAVHDYEAGPVADAGMHQLGCLDEHLVDDTLVRDDISDEDIEHCGYLGWLHH